MEKLESLELYNSGLFPSKGRIDNLGQDKSNEVKYIYNSVVTFHEDLKHEFKSGNHSVKKMIDLASIYISAFLNTEGGTLYFGIEDDGKVTGCRLDRKSIDELRSKMSQTMRRFYPPVFDDMYKISIESIFGSNGEDTGLSIVEIEVHKGLEEELYAAPSGRIYVKRDGAKNELKDISEVWEIARRRISRRHEEIRELQTQMKNLFHESMESISGSIKHYSDQELDKVQSEFQDKLMRYKNIVTHLEASLMDLRQEQEQRQHRKLFELLRENQELKKRLQKEEQKEVQKEVQKEIQKEDKIEIPQRRISVGSSDDDKQVEKFEEPQHLQNSPPLKKENDIKSHDPPNIALISQNILTSIQKKTPPTSPPFKPIKSPDEIPPKDPTDTAIAQIIQSHLQNLKLSANTNPVQTQPQNKIKVYPLRIRNVPTNISYKEIHNIFLKFGPIVNCILAKNSIAYVNFATYQSALQAYEKLPEFEYKGKKLTCELKTGSFYFTPPPEGTNSHGPRRRRNKKNTAGKSSGQTQNNEANRSNGNGSNSKIMDENGKSDRNKNENESPSRSQSEDGSENGNHSKFGSDCDSETESETDSGEDSENEEEFQRPTSRLFPDVNIMDSSIDDLSTILSVTNGNWDKVDTFFV